MSRKLLSLALCLCMALTLTSAVAEGTSFTVTDMTGREVELAAPAQRIVALTAVRLRDPLRHRRG